MILFHQKNKHKKLRLSLLNFCEFSVRVTEFKKRVALVKTNTFFVLFSNNSLSSKVKKYLQFSIICIVVKTSVVRTAV